MRELSPSEKFIVEKIIEKDIYIRKNPDNPHDICITELLVGIATKFNSHFKIENNYNTDSIELSCLRTDNETMDRANIHAFRREFMNAVYFIDYMKCERLIYIVPEDLYSSPNEKFEFPVNYPDERLKVPITDRNFFVLFRAILGNVFIPTEALINFHRNNYRAPDELRFKEAMDASKKAIEYAKWALIVTIVVGALQIIISICQNS